MVEQKIKLAKRRVLEKEMKLKAVQEKIEELH